MLGLGAPKPIAGRAEDIVNCPVASAFDYVGYGFFKNYRKWCPQVIELEPRSGDAIQVGSIARQVTLDRGIRSESTFEVTDFAPPRRLEIKGVSEPFRSAYEFAEETDASTRLSFTFELLELDLVMRPFQKLIRVALEDGAKQTIENLKGLLQVETVPASPVA
jgi:hypothetical protein